MNPHLYEGNLIACLKCFKRQSDPVHLQVFTPPHELEINNHRQAPPSNPVLYSPKFNEPIKSICPSHECPKCKTEWTHNYDCGSKNNGLCEKCAQQNAAEIFRPQHIKEIEQQQYSSWNAKEAKELKLQHEEFVVLTYIRNTDGTEKPDGLEKLAEHIKMQEKCIERMRIEMSASHSVRAKVEVEKLNKLTPEEQEQYKRDAARSKKPKVEKEKKELSKKAYEDKLKDIVKLLMSTNKKLSTAQAGEKAKLMIEIAED